jgi:hypothetical protein
LEFVRPERGDGPALRPGDARTCRKGDFFADGRRAGYHGIALKEFMILMSFSRGHSLR